MRVEEPEPGRVLTESDQRSSAVTTFTVIPEGPGCRVQIESRWQGAAGMGGFFDVRHLPAPFATQRVPPCVATKAG